MSGLTHGQGAPDPHLGVDGDQYLDTESGDLYRKESGAWTFEKKILYGHGAPT